MKHLSERSAKRQQFGAVMRLIQKVQHAVPGVVLLKEGMAAFSEGAAGWHLLLAVAEVTTAATVAVSLLIAFWKVAQDIKAGRAPHFHFGIDWTDIFLGLMLLTETASQYSTVHKWWRPMTLLGLAMIFLGVYGGRIAQRKIEARRRREERKAAASR